MIKPSNEQSSNNRRYRALIAVFDKALDSIIKKDCSLSHFNDAFPQLYRDNPTFLSDARLKLINAFQTSTTNEFMELVEQLDLANLLNSLDQLPQTEDSQPMEPTTIVAAHVNQVASIEKERLETQLSQDIEENRLLQAEVAQKITLLNDLTNATKSMYEKVLPEFQTALR
ncbi:hypothetical protein BC833DRAFT_603972 [Globomyces pollinis-pini]|nr:hypothetical protein BC833DRAFT_603972 [Globomyces pollinis-pini]